MTLTTHAMAGGAIAVLLPNHPYLAAGLAFSSHFILDAFPHWDYPLLSYRENTHNKMESNFHAQGNGFVMDLFKTGLDALLGLTIVWLWLASGSANRWPIIAAALAGILPDPLQFLYDKIRREPLVSLQKFHIWIHTNHRMKNLRFLSFFSQILFIFILLVFLG